MTRSPAVIPLRADKVDPYMRPMFEAAMRHFGTAPVIGVEVGTSTGANATEIVTAWKEITKLYCVDYYPIYSDFMFQEDQDRALNYAMINFAMEPKIHFRIGLSVEVAKGFEPESVDFVYIDANHSYTFVRDDIQAWLPKVKKGGIIGGHDYDWADKEHDDELAVKRAVDEAFGDRVHYHIDLFTNKSGTRKIINHPDMIEDKYTGINSDWWVFV